MAKINVGNVDAVSKRLNRNIRIQVAKIFRDKELRKLVGEIVVTDIKKNVDFGRASDSTIKTRKYLEKYNKTDPAYNPSNVKAVFTGELLKDLQDSVKGFPTEFTFEVDHSDKKHKRYKGKSGPIGKSIAYKEISKYLVEDYGYNYFQLSEQAKNKIIKEIKQRILKLIASMS